MYDMLYLGNIQPTSSHIRSHQDGIWVRLEPEKHYLIIKEEH
jgi:hypothetical protein